MDGLLRFARNDGLMHLSGRKHINVLDHATIRITYAKTKNARDKPGHDAVFVDGQCDVSLRLACNRLAERGLRGGEAGDRHAIG
jgi:hypothetical protein